MPTAASPVSRGLTSKEAEARLAALGANELVRHPRAAWLKEAIKLLLDPMAAMLVVAAAVYFLLGETRDAVVMLAALGPVIGVDVVLEARSQAALKKLAGKIAPQARVVRDGRERTIDTRELVPGDLLLLAEGDFIHADGIVRASANLAIDESSLTGEADPKSKRPADDQAGHQPADENDTLFFAGSLVLAGHGEGEVVATGSRTRFGEIAQLVAAAGAAQTPLQRRVGHLVKQLAIVAAGVAVALVVLGLVRGLGWGRALLGGVSLAMSAAPEEFPLVFTLFLSTGAWRLARSGVLVRRLASVETLGSTTVICTDKTGTLTAGQFVLDHVVPFGDVHEAHLLEAALLASEQPPSDPMELALRAGATSGGLEVAPLLQRWRLLRDHDFDPVGKHMSHVWCPTSGEPGIRVVAKGALEGVLEHATLSAAEHQQLEDANTRLAGQGIRVLAVAERRALQVAGSSRTDDEQGLRPLGLLGFRDPLRPEVPAAVAACQAAGIRIKVVTGDHALTAHAVAESAGIFHRDEAMVTGPELAAASPEARPRLIAEASILSRISPAQKHLIVEALQADGEIVAMTGDGINDAPALRRADIGVSMGKRGTDVARAASDLVLLEDDFASIVAAVAAGRKIFLDIQRAFLYLIAFHIPIVLLALLPPMVGLPLLLLPVHLIWLELIVHPVSALLFQGDPAPADLMQRPPRDPRAPMLARDAVVRSTLSGLLLSAVVFGLFGWAARQAGWAAGDGADGARSVALATLILGYQLLVLVERAASTGGLRALWPRSLRFWLVWGASGVSLPLVLYVPAAARLMKVAPLSPRSWLLALAGAFAAVGWRALLLARPARRLDGGAGPRAAPRDV